MILEFSALIPKACLVSALVALTFRVMPFPETEFRVSVVPLISIALAVASFADSACPPLPPLPPAPPLPALPAVPGFPPTVEV
ncbi:hypothetical protein F3519_05855 [Campylobacter coli]|nr:hypothetical protein [Campylobacter coli]